MMNLTPLGLGVALAIALPASSSAQEEKPVAERAPVLQRGRPTAAPTAAPALVPSAAAPAKGQASEVASLRITAWIPPRLGPTVIL